MKRNKAFSVLEQTVVIGILALISSISLYISTHLNLDDKIIETKRRVKVVEESLLVYYLENSDLPCPSDPSFKQNQKNFARSYNDKIKCLSKPSIKEKQGYYYGAIPTRDLELSDLYIKDAWGNKFSFVIKKEGDDIDVLYYIISHGKNGYHAYNFHGIKKQVSKNINEYNNSNITTSYKNNINDYPPDDEYDDLIFSKTKIAFLKNMSGGSFITPAMCKILENSPDICTILVEKLKKLCLN